MTIKRHHVGPIMSRIVEAGDTVYLQGLTADDKSGTIEEQTANVLAKIDGLLAEAGTTKSKPLSATIYVSELSLRPRMNEVWGAWIDSENPPIRACVGVELDGETKVEIVVTALK